MAKYDPLRRHLARLSDGRWMITFAEIEKIIGDSLPESAIQHKEWWANDASPGRQSRAWLDAGFKKTGLDMERKIVVFERSDRCVLHTPAIVVVPSARSNHDQVPPANLSDGISTRLISSADPQEPQPATYQGTERTKIGAYEFAKMCEIKPKRDVDGNVERLMPQSHYQNSGNICLNKYGQGPFCRFRIPSDYHQAGVYTIIVDGVVSYIGECENLSRRYNMGYGNISPRNCFVGGQETNCRVNTLIFYASTEGHKITLWFFKTAAFKSVERELRALLKPEWNRI